jgi:lysophospholipase L1-like esterase
VSRRAGWVVAATVLAAGGLLGGCRASGATEPRSSAARTTTTTSTSPARPTTAPAPGLVVGLGDSVTAGTACGCTTFIDLYAAGLAERQNRPVRALNLGRAGLSSVGLAQQLATAPVHAQLARADTVVVTIGANDLVPLVRKWQDRGCPQECVAAPVSAMRDQLSGALAQLRQELPPGARVLVTNYWNVFEDGDVADRLYGDGFADWSDAVTKSANAAICAAANDADDHCVDLYEPFEGAGDRDPTALLAGDGDHPDAAGHRLIAQALLDAS